MKTLMVVNQSYEEYAARKGIKNGKILIFLGIATCLIGLIAGLVILDPHLFGWDKDMDISPFFIFIPLAILSFFLVYFGITMIQLNEKRLERAMIKKVEIKNGF